MAGKLKGTSIRAGTISTTQLNSSLTQSISSGGGPKIKTIIYPEDDTAANTDGGQTIYLNGSGFNSDFSLYINGNAVATKSFISSSNVSFTTPALSSATYPVYLVNNTDGAMAILVPGIQYSNTPVWSTSATLSEQIFDQAWNIQLAATSDSNVTYALAAGSSLPAGISLASNGALTGTLSSPPASDTTYNFTVVATDVENQDESRAFSVAVVVTDTQFYLTTLLLHGDGTNNQTNSSFLDSSNNAYSLTRTGNATQGTFTPFSQTGWSNYFDGSGDFLTAPATSEFAFGTGAWTVEFWIYPLAYGGSVAGAQLFGTTNGAATNYNINLGQDINSFRIISNATGTWADNLTVSTGGGPELNTWSHMAISRDGANISIYKNGTRVATSSSATSWNFTGTTGVIGRFNDGGNTRDFTGYLSNLRVIKGSALYDPTQSTLTVPTTALTAVSNTNLLTCQSSRFRDTSTNNFTITRNGDVAVQAFSPFRGLTEYSAANIGGSIYLDGSGDYIQIADGMHLGTTDFTIEFWVCPTVQYNESSGATIFSGESPSNGQTGWGMGFGTYNGFNGLTFAYGTYGQGTGGRYVNNYWGRKNCWDHIVWQRRNSVIECYVNGVVQSLSTYNEGSITFTDSTNFTFSNTTKRIGAASNGGDNYTGYLSGVRIVSGNAVYSGNFTPPTSPPTAVANTKFLANFTNAGIIDSTAKNVIETVGDVKISNTQSKFGNTSIYFDGTGDALVLPSNLMLAPGAGDFTVEAWVYNQSGANLYPDIFSNSGVIIAFMPNDRSSNYRTILGDDNYPSSGNAALLSATGTISQNTWTHLAWVRSGSTITVYIDGVASGTASSSTNHTREMQVVGAIAQGGAPNFYFWNGYIDDLRITKGYARYTANFTAPTSAFKNK